MNASDKRSTSTRSMCSSARLKNRLMVVNLRWRITSISRCTWRIVFNFLTLWHLNRSRLLSYHQLVHRLWAQRSQRSWTLGHTTTASHSHCSTNAHLSVMWFWVTTNTLCLRSVSTIARSMANSHFRPTLNSMRRRLKVSTFNTYCFLTQSLSAFLLSRMATLCMCSIWKRLRFRLTVSVTQVFWPSTTTHSIIESLFKAVHSPISRSLRDSSVNRSHNTLLSLKPLWRTSQMRSSSPMRLNRTTSSCSTCITVLWAKVSLTTTRFKDCSSETLTTSSNLFLLSRQQSSVINTHHRCSFSTTASKTTTCVYSQMPRTLKTQSVCISTMSKSNRVHRLFSIWIRLSSSTLTSLIWSHLATWVVMSMFNPIRTPTFTSLKSRAVLTLLRINRSIRSSASSKRLTTQESITTSTLSWSQRFDLPELQHNRVESWPKKKHSMKCLSVRCNEWMRSASIQLCLIS